jgi:glyoxylate reductase
MNPKPIVAITWPINQGVIDQLRQSFEVKLNEEERVLSDDELKTFVAGSSAILCLLTNKITREVIAASGPQLKIIATMSVGFDHIDLNAAKEHNIVITNTPGTLDNAVAEHTITLLLSTIKNIPLSDTFMRSGKYHGWDPTLFVSPEVQGKTIGIIGLGHIGSNVAKIASAGLSMKVIYNDIKPNTEFELQFGATYYSIDDLLPLADFVTLHVPLLPATTHLINTDRLSIMKKTAFLINTSRGPVIDEAALVNSLKTGTIAGAGLDVYEHEPELTPGLSDLPNVVLTPHTASATIEARINMAKKAAENIVATLTGQQAPDALTLP